MKEILFILVSAILVDNFIFSRFMGCCPFLGVSEKADTALGMGCAVIFVMTVSGAVTYAVNAFLLVPFGLDYLQTIAFIVVIASLVQLMEMFLRKYLPALYGSLGIFLPLITTNCAVLGAALLSVQNGYNFIETVVFHFAAAVGFTLAILVFAGVRVRVALANPPKAFAGMPIALVTAGLVAMAFAGFSSLSF